MLRRVGGAIFAFREFHGVKHSFHTMVSKKGSSLERVVSRPHCLLQQQKRWKGSKSDQAFNEFAFLGARLIFRLIGQAVGALHRAGKLRPKHILFVCAFPTALYGGLLLSAGERIPYSSRLHLVFLSREKESELATEARNELLAHESSRLLPSSAELFKVTEQIAQDLLLACKADGLLPNHLDFKVHVIDSKVPNAFVLPDGSIFVYTGIIPIARTEAGLACILGHEISHALARHAAEKIGIMRLMILLYEFVAGFNDFGRTTLEVMLQFLAVTVLQVGMPLAHSRYMESEADRIGLKLAARAGYDPRHVVQVWQTMQQLEEKASKRVENLQSQPIVHSAQLLRQTSNLISGVVGPAQELSATSDGSTLTMRDRVKELFSTHPCHQRRVEELKAYADAILPEYTSTVDRLSLARRPVPRSNRLLVADPNRKNHFDSFFDPAGLDEQTSESAYLAQRSSALMVGDTAASIEAFLKAIGRENAFWGGGSAHPHH